MELSQPTSSWLATLSEIEQSIQDCIQTLDKYDAEFHAVFKPDQHIQPAIEPTAAEQVMHQWDEKIHCAAEAAKSVDALLDEQEQVWSNWQEKYKYWLQSTVQFDQDGQESQL